MKFDIFFSICQTPVDGYTPSERVMFQNFLSQVKLADQLGFGCAWIAETHLSCQVQKRNKGAVIPHFEGEIGLNTDIFQMAHIVYSQTRQIAVGSAIRNIQCNGGPIAHAEALRTFMSLKQMAGHEHRNFELGFAAGRFPFSIAPYGIRPRNSLEELAWPALRGLVFQQASEIFLRLTRGDVFASSELLPLRLTRDRFRSEQDWLKVVQSFNALSEFDRALTRLAMAADTEPLAIEVAPFWEFDPVGVIPFEAPFETLRLTIGAHDAETQVRANQILPVGVFNLSITPQHQIEKTHELMTKHYNTVPWGASDGVWRRELMPRTALVFIDESSSRARDQAQAAIENYWKAMEGTLDVKRVQEAVENALVGTPDQIKDQMKAKYHPDERLMLWFDFNDHNTQQVEKKMKLFMEKVRPEFSAAH